MTEFESPKRPGQVGQPLGRRTTLSRRESTGTKLEGGLGVTRLPIDVVVAGHICLDVIPTLGTAGTTSAARFAPGSLTEIVDTVIATGGAVANTGLALHRLGVRTHLCAKVGDDLFGHAVRQIIAAHDSQLADGIVVDPASATSYTLVISSPGVDRFFLHCPGANASFTAGDIPFDEVSAAKLLHFGYPPAMRSIYAEDGAELERIFSSARRLGMVTSLDMCMPDAESEAGKIDWRRLLERVLPHVDLFMPSFEETEFMLKGPGAGSPGSGLPQCSVFSRELLAMGAALVCIKLGEQGVYVRSSSDAGRLGPLRDVAGDSFSSWVGRELHRPCFDVEVKGTTGCGDCAIAGLIAGSIGGLTLEASLAAAAAAGACCAEAADAISAVQPWPETMRRVDSGWSARPPDAVSPRWRRDAVTGLSFGPDDSSREGRQDK